MRATSRTKSILVGIECGMSAGFTPAAFDNFRLYRKTQCVGRKRPFWARDIFGRAKVVEKTVGEKAAAHNHMTLRDAGVVPKTAAGNERCEVISPHMGSMAAPSQGSLFSEKMWSGPRCSLCR